MKLIKKLKNLTFDQGLALVQITYGIFALIFIIGVFWLVNTLT